MTSQRAVVIATGERILTLAPEADPWPSRGEGLAAQNRAGTFRENALFTMVSKGSSAGTTAPQETLPAMADWLSKAQDHGIKPDQALALIGMGLMHKLGATANGESGNEAPWVWQETDQAGGADTSHLRRRLELTRLALQTGAPLSTAEVTFLLGARPGGASVVRAGLRARRLSRNVWKLTTAEDNNSNFNDGFRRRL